MIKHDYAELSDSRLQPLKSVKAVANGIAGGYIFLIVCFAVLSVVYTYTAFPAGLLKPFVTAVTVISLIVCGLLSAKRINGFGWLHGALAGIVYTLIRYIFGAMFINGFGVSSSTASMFLIGIIFGAAGGILGINFKKR